MAGHLFANDRIEVSLIDAVTAEEGVDLEPDSRYFLVAEWASAVVGDVYLSVNNKLDYSYRLADNSLVFWRNDT